VSRSDIIQLIFIVLFLINLIWATRKDWYAMFIICMPFNVAKFMMRTPELVSWVMSKIPYASDKTVYGEAEHWATPQEFWDHKSGDCEDYAGFAIGILKDYDYQGNIYTYTVDPVKGIGHALGVVSKDLRNWYVFDLNEVTLVRADNWQAAGDWYVANVSRLV